MGVKFPKYVKFKKTIKDVNDKSNTIYPLIKGQCYDVLTFKEGYLEIADEFGKLLLLKSDDERMELIYD